MDVVERFWSKVDTSGGPDACWPWTGTMHHSGYGVFKVQGKMHNAHRWLYAYLHGDLPRRLVVDHQCHNGDLTCPGGKGCAHKRCVNPAHLRACTSGENINASHLSPHSRTECPYGHPYSPENTRLSRRADGNVWRVCLACWRPADARRHREKRARKKQASVSQR